MSVRTDLQSALDALRTQEQLPQSFRRTFSEVCEPLAAAIATRANARNGGFTVGLNGAQGSGKSTITHFLKLLLEHRGLIVATVALDDFYLTRAQRSVLADEIHPLLATRGVPGTHDVRLAIKTLDSLRMDSVTMLPRFDKSTDDRKPPDAWPAFSGPADVIILEGWCVGAVPEAEGELQFPVNELEKTRDSQGYWRRHVNESLAHDYQRLFAGIDWLIMLAAPDVTVVSRWRSEQEQQLRRRIMQQRGDASRLMNDEQVREFVAHYERLTQHMLAEMPSRVDALVRLDEARRPIEVTIKD